MNCWRITPHRTPIRALPRLIINAVNECAIQAWDEEKLLIDDAIVNQVAPYAFS
ncbi:MAG: hypothetical protein IPK16_12880 [Anaerolineales bacterium]|nr:hypothetical protein [Anaerolineales bacterium]